MRMLLTALQSNDLNAGVNAVRDKDAMCGERGFDRIVVGNMGDRNDLDLWFKSGSLIERVAAVCNNTISVILPVGPVCMPWSSHPNIIAIVYAGAPGEITGPSPVEVQSSREAAVQYLRQRIGLRDLDRVHSLTGFPEINYAEKLLRLQIYGRQQYHAPL
ncbi:hypothetical protein PTI98_007085 [Pleurotus ostreatus]|nr:hypothetical protein PTI98_007085 [Pleurotus ostreatus]